jgi:hypothetical protein
LSNVFSATYDNYVVVLSNIDCNTDAAGIKIKFSGTAGSTYSAAGYFMEYTSGTINGSYYNLDANGVSIGLTSTNNDISLASQVFKPVSDAIHNRHVAERGHQLCHQLFRH